MMIASQGLQALVSFVLSFSVFSFLYLTASYLGFTSSIWGITFWGPCLYFSLISFILKYYLKGESYQISSRSSLLGCALSTGLYLALTKNDGWHIFGLYIIAMAIFHFSEYFTIAIVNPSTLSIDSFHLNHSVQYATAALASWLEWALELYLFPGMKTYFFISYLGFLVCMVGEFIRKGAMLTAKTNFNHIVQERKAEGHELVTHGPYAICRHPSYVGWFYWSIGTQIILLNPLCIMIYTFASWSFFRGRILIEEISLLEFFGYEYRKYQEEVGTGIPYIKGYM